MGIMRDYDRQSYFIKEWLIRDIIYDDVDNTTVSYDDKNSVTVIERFGKIIARYDEYSLAVYVEDAIANVVYNFFSRKFKLVFDYGKSLDPLGRWSPLEMIHHNQPLDFCINNIIGDEPILEQPTFRIHDIIANVMNVSPQENAVEAVEELHRLIEVAQSLHTKERHYGDEDVSFSTFNIPSVTHQFVQLNKKSSIGIQRASKHGWFILYTAANGSSFMLGDRVDNEYHVGKVEELKNYFILHGCSVRQVKMTNGVYFIVDGYNARNTSYIDHKYNKNESVYDIVAKNP